MPRYGTAQGNRRVTLAQGRQQRLPLRGREPQRKQQQRRPRTSHGVRDAGLLALSLPGAAQVRKRTLLFPKREKLRHRRRHLAGAIRHDVGPHGAEVVAQHRHRGARQVVDRAHQVRHGIAAVARHDQQPAGMGPDHLGLHTPWTDERQRRHRRRVPLQQPAPVPGQVGGHMGLLDTEAPEQLDDAFLDRMSFLCNHRIPPVDAERSR